MPKRERKALSSIMVIVLMIVVQLFAPWLTQQAGASLIQPVMAYNTGTYGVPGPDGVSVHYGIGDGKRALFGFQIAPSKHQVKSAVFSVGYVSGLVYPMNIYEGIPTHTTIDLIGSSLGQNGVEAGGRINFDSAINAAFLDFIKYQQSRAYTTSSGYSQKALFFLALDRAFSDMCFVTNPATLTLTWENEPPSFPVLWPNSYPMTVTSGSVDQSVHVTASDPEGDILTWSIGVQAMRGVASVGIGNPGIGNRNNVYYTPNPGYVGTDTFWVSVHDGYGGRADAQVVVNVVDPTPPTADGVTTLALYTRADSFTVYSEGVRDSESGVALVRFPTWTNANGQDDIIWYDGIYDAASDRWYVNITKSNHKNETGAYTTHAYAYDNAGNAAMIGSASVTIDQTPPMITTITTPRPFTNADSFTIYAEGVTDSESGIERVVFPTWTMANGQDDIVWYPGTYEPSSRRWLVSINKSNHKNETGVYITHAYAYDKAGNVTGLASAVVTIDQIAPDAGSLTTPLEVTSADTYTVYAEGVTDNGSGIDRVLFPTWTIANGQDDIVWHPGTYDPSSGRWLVSIKKSNHKNETGIYETHAYAYDRAGNSVRIAGSILVTIRQTPTVTTATASIIDTTTATLGGSVTLDGGAPVTERGIVYSKTNKTPTKETDTVVRSEGSGVGHFSDVRVLEPNNIYYMRAYAINSVGISYGNTVRFTMGVVSKPTVTIESAEASPTKASPIPITITFSEPVTGFDIDDITIINGSGHGFSGSDESYSDSYTLNIMPVTDGRVTVSINANIALDMSDNGNEAADPFTIESDWTPPSVTVLWAHNSPQRDSVIIAIAFNEMVSGVELSDFAFENGDVSNLLGSGMTYTAEITPSSDGLVKLQIKSDAGRDAAGNDSTLASYAFYTYSLKYNSGEQGVLVGKDNQRVLAGTSGTDVSIIVAEGYRFEKWSDGVTTISRIDLNVTGNIDVTATYIANQYTLSYTAGAYGSLDGSVSQTVSHRTAGTAVTAQPNEGFRFVKWSDGSTANPRIDADVVKGISVEAEFAESTSLILSYDAGPNGSIDGMEIQNVAYKAGGETVTALPNPGYIFVRWSDGSTANPRKDAHVTEDISVTAEFSEQAISIYYVSIDPNIGGVSTQSEVIDSATGTASGSTAIAYQGYHFVNWMRLDQEISTDSVFIPAKNSSGAYEAATYRATFAPNTNTPYKVQHYRQHVTGDEYTQLEADNLTGTTDAQVTATAKAYPGFSENASHVNRLASGRIAPDGSLVLKLYYDRETHTVTFEDWNGTQLKTGVVRHEGAAIAPSNPDRDGYTFTGWDIDFVNVTSDLVVTAQYREIPETEITGTTVPPISPEGITEIRLESVKEEREDGRTQENITIPATLVQTILTAKAANSNTLKINVGTPPLVEHEDHDDDGVIQPEAPRQPVISVTIPPEVLKAAKGMTVNINTPQGTLTLPPQLVNTLAAQQQNFTVTIDRQPIEEVRDLLPAGTEPIGQVLSIQTALQGPTKVTMAINATLSESAALRQSFLDELMTFAIHSSGSRETIFDVTHDVRETIYTDKQGKERTHYTLRSVSFWVNEFSHFVVVRPNWQDLETIVGIPGFTIAGVSRDMVSCYYKGNDTYMPIRMLEEFGVNFTWDENSKTATMSYKGKTVVLTIGSTDAYINGVRTPIIGASGALLAPELAPGRTMIPLRFVSEHLGFNVTWDPSNLITISLSR